MVCCLLCVVCCLLFVACGLLFAVCCLLFVQLLYIDFAKLFMMILRMMMMMIIMMRTNNAGLAEGYQPKGTNLRKFGRACDTHTYREKASMLIVTRHCGELRVETLHNC